jgi:hypothetical protein
MSDPAFIDGIGFAAAGLVLATFSMRSMIALRWVAIVSNLAFIAYGYLGNLAPVLLLHVLLLPINVHRLGQLRQRQTGTAQSGHIPPTHASAHHSEHAHSSGRDRQSTPRAIPSSLNEFLATHGVVSGLSWTEPKQGIINEGPSDGGTRITVTIGSPWCQRGPAMEFQSRRRSAQRLPETAEPGPTVGLVRSAFANSHTQQGLRAKRPIRL